MIDIVKESLWKQFGAAIDMLAHAIEQWPEAYWHTEKRFFYIAYHCAVFVDYYLTIPPTGFVPLLPFTIAAPGVVVADAVDDVLPDRIYSKTELLDYLQSSRDKCYQVISHLTPEKLNERWIEEDGDMNYAFLELLLYNMRHVQHHAAQLNLLLRQKINDAPAWVARASEEI